MRAPILAAFALALVCPLAARAADDAAVKTAAAQIFPKVIAWRRNIHSHPELSGREVRTAGLVADHLKSLGLEVTTEVGGHGVIGILKGAKPGKVIALRADMDALPVTEEVDVPFASKVSASWRGVDVGVMHACGHDTHVAILMGVAEILAHKRQDIAGTIKFIFQPAEEGQPEIDGKLIKTWGAKAMVEAGALDNPKVEAIFGLHVGVDSKSGTIGVKPGPLAASSDSFQIRIEGKGAHGALPWRGIDPVVVASQTVLALQTIVSRQEDITKEPAIVTVGALQAGNRENIISDRALLLGTMRTFDQDMRADIKMRIQRTAENIAEAAGAKAFVTFEGVAYGVTVNDPALVAKMRPSLERALPGQVETARKTTTAEDFSEFANRVPGMYLFLSVSPGDPAKAAVNHSPRFQVDEAALENGVKALTTLALDYLAM